LVQMILRYRGTSFPHRQGHSSLPTFWRMSKLVVQGFGFYAVVNYI